MPRCPVSLAIAVAFTVPLLILLGLGHLQPTTLTGLLTVGSGVTWLHWCLARRMTITAEARAAQSAEAVLEAEHVLRRAKHGR